MEQKNVQTVIKNGLCIGCGVCYAICPSQAINLSLDKEKGVYQSHVTDKCSNCGLCLQVCFGKGISIDSTKNNFLHTLTDPILGTYTNCYSGYALDSTLRYNSSSGGVVTALLLFALEQKIIDGVLITKMSEKTALEPQPFIARTPSEVLSAAQSKYCPVPLGVALKTLMSEKGRFAVVGLPCQLYGIKKAEHIYPHLKEKILLHIGLFCGGSPSFLATEFLIRKLCIPFGNVKKIEYRSHGQPSMMSIHVKNSSGNTKQFRTPYTGLWSSVVSLFLQYRCRLCTDAFNAFCDISCGDAWLPEYKRDELCTSLMITRTKFADQLVHSANQQKSIKLNNIEPEKIKKAQSPLIVLKGSSLLVRTRLLKTLRKPLVNNNSIGYKSRITFPGCVTSIVFYGLSVIASKRYLWPLLDIYCLLVSN
jgi:coenzyme F420 hydrogenase subunit beta